MNNHSHDILINGAGPVGSTIALALAKKTDPSRIAIIGKLHNHQPIQSSQQNLNNTQPPILPDPRTIALNHGSQVFLESLNAWPKNSAVISQVHVSQKGRLGRTLISNHDLNVSRLGSVVNYDDLVGTLHEQLRRSGVEIITPDDNEIMFQGDYTGYKNQEKHIKSAISIQSTGIKPNGLSVNYKQDAVLANIKVSNPRVGWAFERFTKFGPLALLPHPLGDEYYAVVWCCPPDMANELLNLTEHEFNHKLQSFFGQKLGNVEIVGARNKFPLNLHVGANLINSRTVAIGNAAQTIHPVAGQGLNLGLRDAAQLSISLAPWLSNKNLDVKSILQQYANKRTADRWLTIGITNTLPQIFSTKISLIEHLCGISLATIDVAPALRNLLTRNLLQGLRF